jgi:hypothetical protein
MPSPERTRFQIHAPPRATKKKGILVKPDADNARTIYAALAQFGAPLEG